MTAENAALREAASTVVHLAAGQVAVTWATALSGEALDGAGGSYRMNIGPTGDRDVFLWSVMRLPLGRRSGVVGAGDTRDTYYDPPHAACLAAVVDLARENDGR